jgi:cupin superfamily acireductone dioxygenase involved in methionine salvage
MIDREEFIVCKFWKVASHNDYVVRFIFIGKLIFQIGEGFY